MVNWQIIRKTIFERIDLIILFFCLLVTYGIWQFGTQLDPSQDMYMGATMKIVANTVQARTNLLFTSMHGLVGLYQASNEVETGELATYVKSGAFSPETVPSLLRIQFLQKIPNSAVPSFQKEMQKQFGPKYQAKLNPNSSIQFYETQLVDGKGAIYPPSGDNYILNEQIKQHFDQVIASRKGGVMDLQNLPLNSGDTGNGFYFTFPVYKKGEVIGILNAIVSARRIKQNITSAVGKDIYWDLKAADGTIVKDIGETGLGNIKWIQKSAPILTEGTPRWFLELQTPKRPGAIWNITLAAGIILSFIVYAITYELSSLNVRAEALAHQMTEALANEKASIERKIIERTHELELLKKDLESKVNERTTDLNKKIEELNSFNQLMIGRELKMIELKKRIAELEKTNG